MSGVHNRAAVMRSFSRFIIFIKSSGLFYLRTAQHGCASVRIVERVLEQKALVPADFAETRPVLERAEKNISACRFALRNAD